MIGQGVLVQKKKLPEHFSAQAAFSLINFFILFSLAFATETVHNNKATPHKDRLTALWHICLHILRHLAHKFLDIRQYACGIYAQSAEKSDCASAPQSLCGVAITKKGEML